MSYDHLNPSNTPIVEIRWEDIYFDDSWDEDSDGMVQPKECITVGYLLEDSPTKVVVGSTYDFNGEKWATIHAIPRVSPEAAAVKDQSKKLKAMMVVKDQVGERKK